MTAGGLRPFFPYHGSKFRWAPRYPAPQHDWIVEPFAGSAGYALRYPDRQVVLVDANEHVADVWQYLTLVSPREVLRLPLLEPGQSVDSLVGVPEPARWLIGMWLFGGAEEPRKRMPPNGPVRRVRGQIVGSRFYLWGAPVRERIASQVDRIRHWIVKSGSFASAPSVRATWFIDPPYQHHGASYPCGSRDIRFGHLGEWCRSRRGQVIVCEAVGATWMPFTPLLTRTCKNGRALREAIWESSQR